MTGVPDWVNLLYDGVDRLLHLRYMTRMALSNAERQARLHKRRMEKLAECVTPDEVREAIRIMFEWQRDFGGEEMTWDEWLVYCQKSSGRRQWSGMAPDSPNQDDYPEELTSDQRALLAKVGAVIAAASKPPAPSSA